MEKTTYKTLTIRLTAQEYALLSQIAQEEGRFINRQAAYWVRQQLRARSEKNLLNKNNSY